MKFYYIVFALILSACVPNNLASSKITVIDGDSIRVDGENVRLIGLNAPETRQAECSLERTWGYKATENLKVLIANSTDIGLVLKRKKNGDPRRDKYGRYLGTLFIDGINVATLQIQAGMARPYDGGRRRSWCN